ncbi:hypothetical protein [Nonomuraea dietziae]|uniref:hypothetical protein n=1 Tax=Nonomuraea dietziae TaxID=65515 RepID=UPI0031E47B7B
MMIAIQVVAMCWPYRRCWEKAAATWAGLAVMMTLTAAGFLGLGVRRPPPTTWLWIAALGVGHGGLFTLVLTLPVRALPRPSGEAGADQSRWPSSSATAAPR